MPPCRCRASSGACHTCHMAVTCNCAHGSLSYSACRGRILPAVALCAHLLSSVPPVHLPAHPVNSSERGRLENTEDSILIPHPCSNFDAMVVVAAIFIPAPHRVRGDGVMGDVLVYSQFTIVPAIIPLYLPVRLPMRSPDCPSCISLLESRYERDAPAISDYERIEGRCPVGRGAVSERRVGVGGDGAGMRPEHSGGFSAPYRFAGLPDR